MKTMPPEISLHVRNALIHAHPRGLPILSKEQMAIIYKAIYDHIDCVDEYCRKPLAEAKVHA